METSNQEKGVYFEALTRARVATVVFVRTQRKESQKKELSEINIQPTIVCFTASRYLIFLETSNYEGRQAWLGEFFVNKQYLSFSPNRREYLLTHVRFAKMAIEKGHTRLYWILQKQFSFCLFCLTFSHFPFFILLERTRPWLDPTLNLHVLLNRFVTR